MADTALKLTDRQRHALVDLGELSTPWMPVSRSVQSVCAALVRIGLAKKSFGYPVGFVITPAGRALLDALKDEGEDSHGAS